VIFDLGRGGRFGNRPTAEFGAGAVAAASAERPESGCVGAGTGAVCGGLKSGFGYAERRLEIGASVAAAVVVNAGGSVVDPVTGRLYADWQRSRPAPRETERAALAAAATRTPPSLGTTIGVLLTDATLTKAQAGKMAALGHDGMARAIVPVHSMFDGDTVFGLASGRRPLGDDPRHALAQFNRLLAAAAEIFAEACLDAVTAAQGRGGWPGYLDLAPSVRPS
jgi:L-aminopeptidase/D-esterase-like protein